MPRWFIRMPVWGRTVVAGIAGLFVLAIIISFFRSGDSEPDRVAFSEVVAAGRAGEIESIEVRGRLLDVTLRGDEVMKAHVGRETDIAAALAAEGIVIGGPEGIELEFDRASQWDGFLPLIIGCIPLIVFALVIYYTIRNAVREGMRRAREDDASS